MKVPSDEFHKTPLWLLNIGEGNGFKSVTCSNVDSVQRRHMASSGKLS